MQIKHLKEKSASVKIDTVAEYKGETKQKLGTIKAVDADGAEVSLEEVEDTEFETDGTEGVTRKVLSDDAEAVESTFDVNSFSTFTVTWNLEKEFITADGETYKITVTYDKDAGIPDGSTLDVRELERGSEEYMYYYNESLRQVGLSPEKDPATGKDTIGNWAEIIPGLMDDARFFDITILHDGQKIEPTKTVDISIQYVNPLNVKEDQVVKAIHFGEDKTELSDTASSADHTSFSFKQDSFSVTGTGTVDKVIDTTLTVGDDVVVTYSEVSTPDTTQDDGPVTTKTVTDNGDGTHKITLDILGKTTTTTTVTKANVIVVLDTSGSMDNDGGVSYQEDSSYNGNYGIVNGQYIQLERAWNGNWYYYEDYYRHQYYGQRYQKTTQSRIEGAKDAVKAIANTLLSKNTSSNPDLVQMALITFATNAETKQMPTTSASIFNNTVNKLEAKGGTNWEAALQQVSKVDFQDQDPTYVIFVSDGNPTFRNTRGSTEYLPVEDNNQWYRTYRGKIYYTDAYYQCRSDNIYYDSEKVYGLGSDNTSATNYSPTSMQRCYDNALDEVKDLVQKHYQLYTIGAYGNVSWMQNFTTEAGAPKNHYYSANDSAALSEALESIADAITNTLGYSNVQTTDGITALSSVSANIGGGIIEGCEYSKGGVPWSDAPGLTLSQDGNSVTWDLSTVGALENGVHYTASFNIWSSQDAYDLVADLNNGLITYDNLSQEQKDQIVKNEDGTYSLKTNTSLNTTFTQNGSTKTQPWDEGNNTMSLVCSAISLQKVWENEQDQQTETEINLIIKKDGATYLSKTLQSDTNWKADIYLAPGVIKTKTNGYDVMETGHDYSIEEENYSDDVYWEFEADIYHPMVIDGKLTLLKRVNDQANSKYTIGKGYYALADNNKTITVKNIRKSSLSLTKKVVDKDNKPVTDQLDDLFTYKITVTDSDPKSAKVKFYVTDDQKTIQNVDVTEAKQESEGTNTNGYYSVDSGKEFQIKLKKGWNLKFVNLSSGSTYFIEEIDIPTGYSFVSWNTGASEKIEGTIAEADQSYTVTNTNKLWTTDLTFIKQDTEGHSLEGAVFEISKVNADGTYEPIDLNGKVDEEKLNKSAILQKVVTGQFVIGSATISGLKDGTYKIMEIKAPDGYGLLTEAGIFTIEKGEVTYTNTNFITYDKQTKSFTIKNTPGRVLPGTGGMGTLIYNLSGLMFMTAALVLGFVSRRKLRERRSK
ncbi:MAG: VWA domain-containing protein [Syntrophomonadaceae bacterium]